MNATFEESPGTRSLNYSEQSVTKRNLKGMRSLILVVLAGRNEKKGRLGKKPQDERTNERRGRARESEGPNTGRRRANQKSDERTNEEERRRVTERCNFLEALSTSSSSVFFFLFFLSFSLRQRRERRKERGHVGGTRLLRVATNSTRQT